MHIVIDFLNIANNDIYQCCKYKDVLNLLLRTTVDMVTETKIEKNGNSKQHQSNIESN